MQRHARRDLHLGEEVVGVGRGAAKEGRVRPDDRMHGGEQLVLEAWPRLRVAVGPEEVGCPLRRLALLPLRRLPLRVRMSLCNGTGGGG